MRSKISIFLMVSLTVSLCVLTTLAQDKEQEGRLFLIAEVVVKPSMASKYEAHVKEVLELAIKHNYPFPYNVFSTNDYHYYYAFPMKNFADMDNLFKASGEWVKQMGEERFQEMMKRTIGTYSYERFFLHRHAPDLSYMPEKPRLKPEEEKFFYWGRCFIQPGKEKEVAENFKKFASLYKDKGADMGWETYVGDIGTKMPVFYYVMYGKDAADFWGHSKKIDEIVGEEVGKIWEDTMTYLRKYDHKIGMYRKELSYTPKKD